MGLLRRCTPRDDVFLIANRQALIFFGIQLSTSNDVCRKTLTVAGPFHAFVKKNRQLVCKNKFR